MNRSGIARSSRRLPRMLILAIVLLALAVLFLSSCSTGITTTEPTPTAASSSSGSETSATSAEASAEEQLERSPAVEGAEKMIAEKNGQPIVVYSALPANPYDFPPGTIIGEFRYNVYIAEDRTGGVALAAPVVGRYLDEALQKLPEGAPRWLLTLPADITDCSAFARIQIDRNAQPFANKPFFIQVSVPGEPMGVVNILASSHKIVIDKFPIYGLDYIISQRSLDTMKIIAGEEMSFLFVIAALDEQPLESVDFQYGDRVGMTEEPVLAGLSSVRGPLTVHEYSCILRCGGVPVFLMANDKLAGAETGEAD